MNIMILCCTQPYEERADNVAQFFLNQGHQVTVIGSDFDHISKSYRKIEKKGYKFIPTKPYTKNFSLARIVSHILFSIKAVNTALELSPDVVYSILPPNYLAYYMIKKTRRRDNIKIIFDLMDLWPETMPVQSFKNTLPYQSWAEIRNKSIRYADYVISECNLYRNILSNVLHGVRCDTVYLCKQNQNLIIESNLAEDELNICYLGSVNNIIDIDLISEFLSKLNKLKRTNLHIIGEGEKMGEFIGKAQASDITTTYHGKIYSVEEKQKIFNQCHFGLNIMKDTVCVGLTMKSLDYFQAGLPIINNIISDTTELVCQYQNGFNINKSNLEDVASKIAKQDNSAHLKMRMQSKQLFIDEFTFESFENKMLQWFQQL